MTNNIRFEGRFSTFFLDPITNIFGNNEHFELSAAENYRLLRLRNPRNVWYRLVSGEIIENTFTGTLYDEALEQFTGDDVLCKLGAITNISIEIDTNETSFILCRKRDTSSSYYIFHWNEPVTFYDEFDDEDSNIVD